MCSGEAIIQDAELERPEIVLAKLMETEMRIEGQLSPVTLRLFLKAHWYQVARLAHEIHDGPSKTIAEWQAIWPAAKARMEQEAAAMRCAKKESELAERKRSAAERLFEQLKSFARAVPPGTYLSAAGLHQRAAEAEALIAQIEDAG